MNYPYRLLRLPAAVLLSFCWLLAGQHSWADEAVSLVIIIDDLGYSRRLGQRAIELPGNITYAVIPNSPNGKWLAQQAHEAGKEIMVHAPMSSIDGNSLENGGLTTAMLPAEFLAAVQTGIQAVPHALGLNNHMGSELTQRPEYMRLLMQVVAKHNFYFIDSRTSAQTIAAKMAERYRVRHLSRDVFLDNNQDYTATAAAFDQLLRIAKKKGVAVGIGHPYPSTLQFLEQALPTLAERGVILIPGSTAIDRYYRPSEQLAERWGQLKPSK
ncbi:MAG: divergent polysaccharide deacetylase family protein [Pseudomonadales bacterium]